jgi:hypothetical protein
LARSPRPLARLLAVTLALATTAWPHACAGALALAAMACSHAYVVEDRETPVHVWLEAPAAVQGDVATHVTIHVGDRQVLDGPVRFPAGQTRIELPTVYLKAGERNVSVAIGGRAAARETAKVRHATWILVSIRGAAADVSVHDREPGSP